VSGSFGQSGCVLTLLDLTICGSSPETWAHTQWNVCAYRTFFYNSDSLLTCCLTTDLLLWSGFCFGVLPFFLQTPGFLCFVSVTFNCSWHLRWTLQIDFWLQLRNLGFLSLNLSASVDEKDLTWDMPLKSWNVTLDAFVRLQVITAAAAVAALQTGSTELERRFMKRRTSGPLLTYLWSRQWLLHMPWSASSLSSRPFCCGKDPDGN